MMKTVARTVEKDRIHLYLHLIYVNSPETKAKNEYHRRVSPIVRKGGLPRLVHNSTMNEARTRSDADPHADAIRRLSHRAISAPAADNTAAEIPNHMNTSHVMTQVLL